MAFLHAKLMEHMMEWVYTNPPPDMAEALAVYERGAAVREAAAAAAAAKAAKKSAAAKALREKGAMEAAQVAGNHYLNTLLYSPYCIDFLYENLRAVAEKASKEGFKGKPPQEYMLSLELPLTKS